MVALGWRWMFVVIGMAGLMVAMLWYAVHRNPQDVGPTSVELAYYREGDLLGQRVRVTLAERRQLFRPTWDMILDYFGMIYLSCVYTACCPVISRPSGV